MRSDAVNRQRVVGLIRLTRPLAFSGAGLLTVTGAYLGGNFSPARVGTAAATVALAVAAANTFNDLRDLTADGLNRPGRPLPARIVTPCQARVLAAGLGLGALALASRLGGEAVIATGILTAVGFAYSAGLKALPLVGHLTVASLVSASLFFGALTSGGQLRPWVWLGAGQVLFFIFLREAVKSIPDLEGDRRVGSRSAVVSLGVEGTVRLLEGLGPIYLLVLVAPLAWGANLLYLPAVLAGNALPSLLLANRLRRRPGASAAREAVAASPWIFLTGSIALAAMVPGGVQG
jgi:4-hydroxybenzoate polyprenyltransferase